jgi:hypothetical protein
MTSYKAHLKSTAPISFSRYLEVKKTSKESHEDYDEAQWRNRANVDKDGNVIIPPFAIKNMLDGAAARLGMRTGVKTRTFKAVFESSIMVLEGIKLPFTRETLESETRMVPSDGKPSAYSKGARVQRTFPKIEEWEGDVTIHVLDEAINQNVLKQHLEHGGLFIGLGSFRVQNRGIYGRFIVESLEKVG